jgi:hypothetical protein
VIELISIGLFFLFSWQGLDVALLAVVSHPLGQQFLERGASWTGTRWGGGVGTEEAGKVVLELGFGRMNARSSWSGRGDGS